MKKKQSNKPEAALPIAKTKFNTVFERATPELKQVGRTLLEISSGLSESRFSATDKAITFSTEIAYGFMRSNSKCVELNLFLPLDYDFGAKWKESRHTASKKLGTLRLIGMSDVTPFLRETIVEAHRLSARPRKVDIETKEGFIAALKNLRTKP